MFRARQESRRRKTMALNSRRKGCEGERAACHALAQMFGWRANRAQQHSGYTDGNSPDIIVHDTPSLFWEIKRRERFSLIDALRLAVRQAGRKTAVVMHRPDRSPVGWMLTIRLEDLPSLVHAYDSALDNKMVAPSVPNANAGDCTRSR